MALDTSPKTRGEPSIESLASGLGTLGRYGDSYMIHAAEGETIVPREILEANPGLREDLFRQMQMAGIENPNRYVVGDQLNSINPVTGQPEFFFKKLWRSAKKIVKKFAPMIAPIIGNMILPGIGGLIASGLLTKARGGSWGDALKSAGMAYLGNVASAGIMGGINAPSGEFFSKFGEGISQGISAPFDAISGLIQGGAASPLQQGIFATDPVGAAAPGISLKDKIIRQYDPRYLDQGVSTAQVSPRVSPTSRVSNTTKPVIQPQPMTTDVTWDTDLDTAWPSEREITPWKKAGQLKGRKFLDALKKQNLYEGSLAESLRLKYPDLPDRVIADMVQGPPEVLDKAYYDHIKRYRQPYERRFMAGATTDIGSDFPTGDPELSDLRTGLNPDYRGRVPFATTDVSWDVDVDSPYYNPETGALGEEVYNPSERVSRYLQEGKYAYPTLAEQEAKVAINPEAFVGSFGDRGAVGEVLNRVEVPLKNLIGDEWAAKATPWVTGAGLAGAALYAGGAWDEAPPPPPTAPALEREAYRKWNAMSESEKNSAAGQKLYWTWNASSPFVTRADFERRTGGPSSNPDWWFLNAAGGGEVMGPGSGTSDSIPARLSDGEFVMTARAVENAGGGNRSLGAARMYDMMNRFEQGAA